jgi:hypothetical protein
MYKISSLVGGLEHFLFFHILEIIIPTDELHHFSEGWLNQISQISLQSTIRTFAMKCRSSEIPFRALSSAMAMVSRGEGARVVPEVAESVGAEPWRVAVAINPLVICYIRIEDGTFK